MSTTVYAAMRNSDQTEGRGPLVIVGLFTQEADAYKVLNKEWGSTVRTHQVFDNVFDFASAPNDKHTPSGREFAVRMRQASSPEDYAEYLRLKKVFE